MRLHFQMTDENRIADAITAAERKTSGEIVAVVISGKQQLSLCAVPLGRGRRAADAVAAHPSDVVAGDRGSISRSW